MMYTKLISTQESNRARKLQFLVSAICLLLALTHGGSAVAQDLSGWATAEEALRAALDEHLYLDNLKQQPGDAAPDLQLDEIRIEGAWAYAVATAETAPGATPRYVVLLAFEQSPGMWTAVAPGVGAEEYSSVLSRFPDRLIDPATRAYLQPVPATKAGFTEHRLPWPAGRSGYVPKKDGSGHENQIDFNIYSTDSIYTTKPGEVVFVKESSSSSCTVAPPDPCWKKANMVVVKHATGEYSWYVHLAYNSVPVNVGSYVELGTKIGLEGSTGYSTGKHLHFMTSTGHTTWTDPANANDAPWATGVTTVDFDESTWSNLKVGNTYVSQNTSDPSAVSWGSGRVDLFVHGEDNALWQRSFRGSWGSWSSLGGILVSSPDAASWASGHLDVYVRGLDNNIYYRRYLNGSWSGWVSAGQPSVGTTSSPAVVSRSYGRVDLFVRGGDNALWHRSYYYGWGSWTSLGGPIVGGPDVASWTSNHMEVVVRGTDNQLYTRRYLGGSWSGWQSLGGILTADPSAVSPGYNQVSVFVRGITKELWRLPYTGSWGSWELLGGFLTSGPDAASWGSGHLDVFVRGSDDNIYHRWNVGSGWSGWEYLGRP
jgi:murein DD-endopeptidase MepM/ murein hydrolase activator NlpD